MLVTVRLFAALRETAGHSTLQVDLADGATAADALAQVPMLSAWQGRVGFARDGEMILQGTTLHDGDVLDCLPPVSGG